MNTKSTDLNPISSCATNLNAVLELVFHMHMQGWKERFDENMEHCAHYSIEPSSSITERLLVFIHDNELDFDIPKKRMIEIHNHYIKPDNCVTCQGYHLLSEHYQKHFNDAYYDMLDNYQNPAFLMLVIAHIEGSSKMPISLCLHFMHLLLKHYSFDKQYREFLPKQGINIGMEIIDDMESVPKRLREDAFQKFVAEHKELLSTGFDLPENEFNEFIFTYLKNSKRFKAKPVNAKPVYRSVENQCDTLWKFG